MFHFRFDLEDSVDESTFPQDVHEAHNTASAPQKTGEPFSEMDLDSLVCIARSSPCMQPHCHESSLARSITDQNIILFYL